MATNRVRAIRKSEKAGQFLCRSDLSARLALFVIIGEELANHKRSLPFMFSKAQMNLEHVLVNMLGRRCLECSMKP